LPNISLPTPGGDQNVWATKLNLAINKINDDVDAQGSALPLKLDVSEAPELIFETLSEMLVEGSNVTLDFDPEEQTITISATGGGSGGTVEWDDIQDKPTFATVATSGSYTDLSDKPTIPDVSGLVPETREVNGHALSTDVTLDHEDVGAAATVHTHEISDVTGLQDALNDKLESVTISDIEATGTPSATTFLSGSGTWATPSGGEGGPTQWGLIEGDIEDQGDLVAALGAKQDAITDSDDITEGETHLFLTSAERTKLGGIEEGAEVNAVDSVNGQTGAVELDIPDPEDFATAAQGLLADTAVQPTDLATVATTGAYSDLSGTPTIPDPADFATAEQGELADTAVQPGDLATVATTGSYNDLSDKPTIPSVSGLVPNTRTVNGQPLSADVVLDAEDVGALPDDYVPPAPTLQEVLDEGDNSAVEVDGVLGLSAATMALGASGNAFLIGGSTAAVGVDSGETGVLAHKPGGVDTVSVAVDNTFAIQATVNGVTVSKDTTFTGEVSVPDDTFTVAKTDGLQEALDEKFDDADVADDFYVTGLLRGQFIENGGVVSGNPGDFAIIIEAA